MQLNSCVLVIRHPQVERLDLKALQDSLAQSSGLRSTRSTSSCSFWLSQQFIRSGSDTPELAPAWLSVGAGRHGSLPVRYFADTA